MSDGDPSRVTGHLRVEERARSGRLWVATYVARDGAKRRKALGPAWVRDSGRRTARGAVVWRAASGTCPPGHLTPKAAQEALDVLLATERSKAGRRPRQRGMTFGDAADAFLRHAASVGGARGAVAPTTLRGYRSVIAVLAADFPPDLPLTKVTSAAVERYQERLLTEVPDGRDVPLARSTVRQRMLALRAILERAVALGWLGTNPAAPVRVIPQPTAEPDFNVIEPSQVEAIARAIQELDEDELPHYRRAERAESRVDEVRRAVMLERRVLWADVVRVAAFTGLRLGELRALRWRDVDFASATLHVRRNAPVSAPAGSRVKVPKSRYARSVPLIDSRRSGPGPRQPASGRARLADRRGGPGLPDARRRDARRRAGAQGLLPRARRRRPRASTDQGEPDDLPRPAPRLRNDRRARLSGHRRAGLHGPPVDHHDHALRPPRAAPRRRGEAVGGVRRRLAVRRAAPAPDGGDEPLTTTLVPNR